MRGRVVAGFTAFAVMSVIVGVQIAQADTSTLGATDDTYTSQSNATSPHGGNPSLAVNAAPGERRAYLKFTVTGVPDGSTEVGAVLRLWSPSASSGTFTVWSVASTWTQSMLTWNNQPALGAAVASRTGVTVGYNDFNLSSHVTGNGTYAVAITKSSTTQTKFDSREAASGTPPQLVVSWTPPTTTTSSTTTTTDTTTTTSDTTTTTSDTTTTTTEPTTTTTDPTTTTSSTTTSSTTTTTTPPAGDPKVAAAGDIACAPPAVRTSSSCHQLATSNLLAAGNYDAVVPVGDLQYECGQASAFSAVYNPSWGRFKSTTRPVHGDHEYTGPGGCSTPGSAGYYSYFAGAASPRQPTCVSSCQGYYSYELGTWHVVVLNSDCSQPGVGGCSSTSPQGRWLAADLAAHPNQCTLAFWHLPRWGESGGTSSASNYFASALYNAHAEVVVSGNTHFYARSAPQNPAGGADPVNGIRQFIVGTGGKSLHGLSGNPDPQVEVRQNTTFGILELTLHPGSYSWRFVPEAGRTFTDSGTNSCH
jgi:acid phosphatase type 7